MSVWNDIRMIIACKLLLLVMSIAPKNKDGLLLIRKIKQWAVVSINEQENHNEFLTKK